MVRQVEPANGRRGITSTFATETFAAMQALVLTILLFFREDPIGWVHMDFGSCESLVASYALLGDHLWYENL